MFCSVMNGMNSLLPGSQKITTAPEPWLARLLFENSDASPVYSTSRAKHPPTAFLKVESHTMHVLPSVSRWQLAGLSERSCLAIFSSGLWSCYVLCISTSINPSLVQSPAAQQAQIVYSSDKGNEEAFSSLAAAAVAAFVARRVRSVPRTNFWRTIACIASIWSATIQAALTFVPPTRTALIAILFSSFACKAAMLAWQMVDDTARRQKACRCAVRPRLPLLHPTRVSVSKVEEPCTCPRAVVVPNLFLLLQVIAISQRIRALTRYVLQ